MFMAQDPQIPSRHERRKVKVGSDSFLILIWIISLYPPKDLDQMSLPEHQASWVHTEIDRLCMIEALASQQVYLGSIYANRVGFV